ncbi:MULTISPECIES: hypothetical protein [unclassified Pseudomonas]|uniref:hypothetical protein n=1 Tax=unclassified Pseudomonas TaxID=196821 RepID=UPI000D8D3503|nr:MULTISPECIES: hypothetical protein [unclassified Pseudomonas]PYG79886.1 hypothetical protein N428_02211 [Pseudomonas sp. RV120224-01c]PYG83610.1 hypothetical protein N436_01961 [Pseudomonas sp. RV120224-01b]
MPTENRSSNTEMVSVQATIESLEEAYAGDSALGFMSDAANFLRQLKAISTPQPHPEPIAWMVGTAIWWTKEEAERDAATTGKTITPFGPMFDTVEVDRLKQELLAARAQGRTEVVEMIIALEAETGLDDFIGSHQIGCTGEWGSHWKEDELRQHFDVDPTAASELELCRHSGYEIILLEEERDSLRAQLAERDALLTDIEKRHWSGVDFDLPADLVTRIKAISLSAEPEAPGKQGAPLKAVRANDIQDLLDRAATAIGHYGDSLLGRGQREDSVDLLDLEREVRDLEQEFRGAFALPGA